MAYQIQMNYKSKKFKTRKEAEDSKKRLPANKEDKGWKKGEKDYDKCYCKTKNS